ncbi:hypothetical protein SAMN06295970_13221 [Noviherbaspirillum suwonense]|uniref:Integrase n=1 Tax=Noviherbaspirillum suwonense TaxID=1224511 RepID=A0ABY1QVC9_9BURK|nr:hypothetical protein SAMN06295970_13221 [Noviherbaspirillum suwonense]
MNDQRDTILTIYEAGAYLKAGKRIVFRLATTFDTWAE